MGQVEVAQAQHYAFENLMTKSAKCYINLPNFIATIFASTFLDHVFSKDFWASMSHDKWN